MKHALTLLGPFAALVAVFLSAFQTEKSILVLSSIAITIALALQFAAWFDAHRDRRVPIAPFACLTAVCLSVVVSVAAFDWPLRLVYTMSRSSLEAIAAEVAADLPIDLPRRAGWVTVRKIAVRRGVVCLWTGLHSEGDTGFLNCSRDAIPLCPWSVVSLDRDWQFVAED